MKLTRDQKLIIWNDTLWSVFQAFNAGFLIAFGLALGASNTIIGILGAIPHFATLLLEMPGARLVEYFSRKSISVTCSTISYLLWAGILAIPYAFTAKPVLALTIIYFLSQAFWALRHPAKVSWLADLIPEQYRGQFWGVRSMLFSLASMLATLVAGTYLDIFPEGNLVGFATLFGAGMIFGLTASWVLTRVEEPEYQDHEHHHIREFFTLKGEFKTFCFIMVFFNFAWMFASPFFTVYMLDDLALNYTTFVIVGAVAKICRILAQPHFGMISDKYGDKPVAAMCIIGTALVPLAYMLITKQTTWFIIPANMLAGIAWAGTDLAVWNLLLDLTQKEKRALQVAEYKLYTSIPLIIGPILGGLVADNLRAWALGGIPLVFAIGFVLRFVSGILLLRLKEPRAKHEYPVGEVFRQAVRIHPVHGFEHAIHVVTKRVKNCASTNFLKHARNDQKEWIFRKY